MIHISAALALSILRYTDWLVQICFLANVQRFLAERKMAGLAVAFLTEIISSRATAVPPDSSGPRKKHDERIRNCFAAKIALT